MPFAIGQLRNQAGGDLELAGEGTPGTVHVQHEDGRFAKRSERYDSARITLQSEI
jgi:hypothetical protein